MFPFDFQNLALPGTGLEKAVFRVDTALALQPNVVLMALSAHDLEVFHGDQPAAGPTAAARNPVVWARPCAPWLCGSAPAARR